MERHLLLMKQDDCTSEAMIKPETMKFTRLKITFTVQII